MTAKYKINSHFQLPEEKDYYEKPSYIDKEGKLKLGYPPSIVDSSEYESIKELFEKYIKTGLTRFAPVYNISIDANASLADKIKNAEEALKNINPMYLDGFDISDAKRIVDEGQRALEKLKKELDDSNSKSKTSKTAPAKAGAEQPPKADEEVKNVPLR